MLYILLQEIFGDNKALWFLPVFSSFGDGVVYPQRGQLDEEAGLLEGQSPTNTSATTTVVGGVAYASEEHVPMMLCASEEDEEASRAAAPKSSSSSSEEAAVLQATAANGSSDARNGQIVAINM